MKQQIIISIITASLITSCSNTKKSGGFASVSPNALKPVIITEQVQYDTDDPAIWINKTDVSKSIVVGTDKQNGGGLYAFDINGKIINKLTGLQRPNNVDIAYGLMLNGKPIDIAVFTERNANSIRVVSLPKFSFIDNAGIPVFENETQKEFRDGMGIALYTAPDNSIYAIVGRKTGSNGTYLWQYKLQDDNKGNVTATLVRKFGNYSGKKEIEAIAVDNEAGFVYYCDEQVGVRKYFADPAKGDEELAFFGTSDFKEDNEGISIYKTGATTGYILISNQQDNSFNVYRREGDAGKPHAHTLIARIPLSTIESDGSDVSNVAVSPLFPKGLFVAMSNGKVFHYYNWSDMEALILQQQQ